MKSNPFKPFKPNRVYPGDCLGALKELPDCSVETVITDPPYELGFMGKGWDKAGVSFDPRTWWEVLRVTKPGGTLLAFGGTRTFHRIACAIEDAGWIIRDSLSWLYGTGFPKSLDISKAIDKAAGAKREKIPEGKPVKRMIPGADQNKDGSWIKNSGRVYQPGREIPVTEDAKTWEGWGTALKPSWEPIIVAMRPLDGTFEENARKWGVAGLCIDGCRLGATAEDERAWERLKGFNNTPRTTGRTYANGEIGEKDDRSEFSPPKGRWPANTILAHHPDCALRGEKQVKGGSISSRGGSRNLAFGMKAGKGHDYTDANGMETVEDWACHPECPVRMLDEQGGERPSNRCSPGEGFTDRSVTFGAGISEMRGSGYGDTGGASRFYYTTKASRREREIGLRGRVRCSKCGELDSRTHRPGKEPCIRNYHPTVKPVDLMRWLCRLTMTPFRGAVLDPFAGSGTTGVAAYLERRPFLGIELEEATAYVAQARIDAALAGEFE